MHAQFARFPVRMLVCFGGLERGVEIWAVGDRWIKTVRHQLSMLRLSPTHRVVEKVTVDCTSRGQSMPRCHVTEYAF